MKLSEVKPTLQEALGLRWVFDLYESMNARFDDEAWHREGSTEVGNAEIDGEQFKIILEPGTYPIGGYTYSFINAAFQKIIDGKPVNDLQLTSKNASKIVGAISNALLDRVQLHDFDAVLFIADDNSEDRMRVYNKIAERKWTRLGVGEALYNIDLGNGRLCTILYRKDLGKQKLDTFIEYLKTKKKR